jgi:hypothetical protein
MLLKLGFLGVVTFSFIPMVTAQLYSFNLKPFLLRFTFFPSRAGDGTQGLVLIKQG